MTSTRMGSMHWTLRRKGRMTFKDQITYVRSSALVQLKARLPHLPFLTEGPSTKHSAELLEQVKIPSSPLIQEAQAYVRDLATDTIFYHSIRAYFWGSLLRLKSHHSMDEETFYLSCLFHDLGLTSSLHGKLEGAECFTLESAQAGQQFLQQHDVAEETQDTIFGAITLHLNPIVDGKENGWIAHYLNAGTACDVIGARYGEIHKSDRQTVLQRYPRGTFKSDLIRIFEQEAAMRPCSRIALMNRFGFLKMIQCAPFSS